VGGTLPEGRCAQRPHDVCKKQEYRSRMQRRPTELSNPRADLAARSSVPFWLFYSAADIPLRRSRASRARFNAPGTPRRNSANTSTAIAVYESSEQLQESLREKPSLSSRHPSHPISPSSSTSLAPISKSTASALLSPTLPPGCSHKNLRQNSERPSSSDLSTPSRASASPFLRQPMGSSDFSVADYSYDDMWPGESDPELKHSHRS